MWALTLIAATLIIMLAVGVASSSAGSVIKSATNGTFVEHSGVALESWGNDLIHTVKTTVTALCVVTLVGAVVWIRLKSH